MFRSQFDVLRKLCPLEGFAAMGIVSDGNTMDTCALRAGAATAVNGSFVSSGATEILRPRYTENTARFYRPELDTLRFFAFFGVFLHHTAAYAPEFFAKHHIPASLGFLENAAAKAGAYGVDLFFVLSAYLITELLLREKGRRGALDVGAFYIRRALRIWPLYYSFIALVALVPAWRADPRFGTHYLIPFLFFVGNWSCFAFGFPAPGVWVLLWSVCVEEQFYLFWPPIVSRLSRRNIALAAFGMIAVANIARLIATSLHTHPLQIWCNTLARLDPIAIGILVAVALGGNVPSFGKAARSGLLLSGIVSLMLVGKYADLDSSTNGFPPAATLIGYPSVAIACALIFLGVLGSRSRLAQSAMLSHLGKISYGLYVYHVLAIWIADRVLTIPSGLFRGGLRFCLALGLTVLLASVSYRFLESPFLNLKRLFTHVPSRPV
jgi:peptidoglycan/LPS O-acetylase OafA/YrhL